MSHTRAVRAPRLQQHPDRCWPRSAPATATSASASAGATANWVPTATLATSIQGAALAGDASPATRVRLAVTLEPQNATAEQAALRAMYQVGSATYHKFLTPAQWEAAYAPTTAQVGGVESYLSGNGFTGLSVQSDRLLISATGTVADAEHAFNMTIGDYTMPNGSTFQAPSNNLQHNASFRENGSRNWRLSTSL